MVHHTYVGLGPPDAAVREFNTLRPWVLELLALRAECTPLGADDSAICIALDGLRTAAYHFTRRADFYFELEAPPRRPHGNRRLSDRTEAIAAFKALTPYSDRLRQMRLRCRPFGRDYLALDIAHQGLETAAFHFTHEAAFYGAQSDSSGPIRPAF